MAAPLVGGQAIPDITSLRGTYSNHAPTGQTIRMKSSVLNLCESP